VDVSVQEKNLDGTLKELHRASGGSWGGNCVTNNYIAWLTDLFGAKSMEKLKRDAMEDYVDLLREFESKKRNIIPGNTGLVTFRVSSALKEFHDENEDESIAKKISRMNIDESVKMNRDKLRVSADIARGWFQEPIDKTIRHITGILAEPDMGDVNTVLLVGGFAECIIVQEAVKKAVGGRTVIIPEEAGLAVLKGAVRFGHQPRLVTARCPRFTYGFAATLHFDESELPLDKMVAGTCGDNSFEKVLEIGKPVEVGKDIKAPSRRLLNKQGGTVFRIYASTERNPKYVTDPSCTVIGELNVYEDDPGEALEDNEVEIYLAMGDTELTASVKILKTGKILTKSIDCL